MANAEGYGRSNHVKVKDWEGLKKSISIFEIGTFGDIPNENRAIAFEVLGEYGSWSLIAYDDDDTDSETYFDPQIHILPFLEDGEILVLIECGHERLRYIWGNAEAHRLGEDPVVINLGNIYDEAAKAFYVNKESISVAEY